MDSALLVPNYSHPSPYRLASASLLACLFAWPATSMGAVSCKPLLSVKTVREVRLSNAQLRSWVWKATIVADNAYCATEKGAFEIDFIRAKEDSPDVQFTEKFQWASRQFDVTVELAADESIHDYRIGFIAPCVCREYPYKLPQPNR